MRLKSGRGHQFNALISALPQHLGPVRDDAIGIKTTHGFVLMDALADLFMCPSDLTHPELNIVVREAVKEALELPSVTHAQFLEVANKQLTKWYKRKPEWYRLWSRTNLRPDNVMRFKFGTLSAQWLPDLTKTLRKGFAFSESTDSAAGGVLCLAGYFRHEDAAGFTLSKSLSEIVALGNLTYSRRFSLISPESGRAAVRRARYSYLQCGDHRYSPSIWFDPSFDAEAFADGRADQRILHDLSDLLSRIRKASAKNKLLRSAITAATLLNSFYESKDNSERLRLAWACFEHIFSSSYDESRGASHRIAKRAAKFDVESSIREAILTTLAMRRNEAAHSVDTIGGCHVAQGIASNCAQFMEWIIIWMVNRGSLFASKDEFIEWIDIPKDREKMLKRLKLHTKAYSYWHPKLG